MRHDTHDNTLIRYKVPERIQYRLRSDGKGNHAFYQGIFCRKGSDRTPLVVSNPQEEKNTRRGIRQTQGISRYRISLTKRYKGRKLYQGGDYKEGKSLTLVSVSGYVRSQPYGPGKSLRKTIWVDGFMRGQWVKSGITYVTVTD